MSGDDVLLGKADQLMRRHRSFVASAQREEAEPPAVSEAVDDLPLLTEVVSSAADLARRDEGALSLRLQQLALEQRSALLREFERWLDEQLPQVVVSAMDGITDRLVGQITRRARAELLPRLQAMAAQTDIRPAEDQGVDGGGPV